MRIRRRIVKVTQVAVSATDCGNRDPGGLPCPPFTHAGEATVIRYTEYAGKARLKMTEVLGQDGRWYRLPEGHIIPDSAWHEPVWSL